MKEFAVRLATNKFTSSTISVIEQQQSYSVFDQDHQMLDDWTINVVTEARCRFIMETFLKMHKKAQSNSIFGAELKEYVSRTVSRQRMQVKSTSKVFCNLKLEKAIAS